MKSTFSLIVLWLLATSALAATNKPNILVILADDAGYVDFGFQGGGINGDYAALTPNLDRLATNGVRFTSGYVTQPYCCPSRAGLLTGRYQQRFGFENNTMTNATAGLATNEVTMANRLKAIGYHTHALGKWHMGERPEFHPNARGFDEFFGFLTGARTYFQFTNGPTDPSRLQRNGNYLSENSGQYLTDLLATAATNYIALHAATNTGGAGSPFFMYLAFNSVHKPMQAKIEDLTNAIVAGITNDPHRRTNAAMTLALDRAVGTVMNQLTNSGIHTNTLVVFLSDNGGPENGGGEDLPDELQSPNWSDNGPLRGRKTTLYEGGIRVPFVIHWPGKIPAQVLDDPVISLDLLPTFLAAADTNVSPGTVLDGINLLPRLTGATTNPIQRCLFWRSRLPTGELSAARLGDWKFFRDTNGVSELYHLPTDISESTNLAAAFPAKVAELAAAHADWERGMILPLWDSDLGAPKPSTDALTFGASSLGYVVEKTNSGPGTLRYQPRTPLSLSNDWTLTWSMESEVVAGYERNGYIILGDGLDTNNIIRVGMNWTDRTNSIIELQNGNSTSRSFPGPIADTYYCRLDFVAASNTLVFRYGTNQPTLRYETNRVVHVLTGTYGELTFAGYALQSKARTHFSPILLHSNPLAPGSSPSWTRLQMARDYTAGGTDTNGNFLGGTEFMSLVPHKDKLYAGLSYWNEAQPHPGAQVLVKDSAASPWRQEKAFGTNFVRVECLRSLTLTTDKDGEPLNPHVNLLLAGVSEGSGNVAGSNAFVFVRNDVTGDWTLTSPGSAETSHATARFLFDHQDRETGIHHVFCGFGESKLVRGGYDTNSGLIVWNSATPELIGSERILSGGNCNGYAYVCVGSDGNPNNDIGGVFWREDGSNAVWHLIVEFPDHPIVPFEDVRGFTAVPHPKGFDYDVALVTLNSHSKVIRLDPIGGDPRNGHVITEELNIETFLGDQWDNGTPISDNIITAYNDMPALPDPATGELVHFLGLYIKEHPAGTNTVEYNNTYYLIRRLDATYDWGRVADPADPIPDPFLRSCRAACLSPFPGETNRVLYLGGFDGATFNSWHNTAWAYRAELPDERASIRLDAATPVIGLDTTFGWNYQLEGSQNFTNFQPVGLPVFGSNTVREVWITNGPPDREFYRWRISR